MFPNFVFGTQVQTGISEVERYTSSALIAAQTPTPRTRIAAMSSSVITSCDGFWDDPSHGGGPLRPP
jgi:hypothetical protein